MVEWTSLRGITFTLAPLLLPKLFSWYRSTRVETLSQHVAVQSLPKSTRLPLNVLFFAALAALVTTLPYFAAENIFDITQSRLQTPNEVLFWRLAGVRGSAGLSDDDQRLQPRLASLDARLLFLVYGPQVFMQCVFCNSKEPLTYFAHALPILMLPYLLNLLAIGLATSSLIGDSSASRWRLLGIILGTTIAALECLLTVSYDWKANARALRPEDYRLFFWNMRVARGLLICIADAVLAGIIYLTSTNRMFVKPPSTSDRREMALKLLDQTRAKINGLSIVRNAIVRDEGLRRRTDAYWLREGKALGEIMSEREVIDGVRNALSGRVQIAQVEAEARLFTDNLTFS